MKSSSAKANILQNIRLFLPSLEDIEGKPGWTWWDLPKGDHRAPGVYGNVLAITPDTPPDWAKLVSHGTVTVTPKVGWNKNNLARLTREIAKSAKGLRHSFQSWSLQSVLLGVTGRSQDGRLSVPGLENCPPEMLGPLNRFARAIRGALDLGGRPKDQKLERAKGTLTGYRKVAQEKIARLFSLIRGEERTKARLLKHRRALAKTGIKFDAWEWKCVCDPRNGIQAQRRFSPAKLVRLLVSTRSRQLGVSLSPNSLRSGTL
jgi:hypothetical protein